MSPNLFAQSPVLLDFRFSNSNIEMSNLISIASNEGHAQTLILNLKDSLNKEGFFEAGVDSINKMDTAWIVYFHLGNKIEKSKLIFDSETKNLLGYVGVKEVFLESTEYSSQRIYSLFEEIISYWENRGYPFASVRLSLADIDNQTIYSSVVVDKGKAFFFDTINISGNTRVSKGFIAALTQIKVGKPYNESLVKDIDRLISTLPFVIQTQPSTILFIGNKAKPMLYLEHRSNDFVDGIIGFAPSTTLNQKLLITGELRIKLGNLFQGGQVLDANLRFFDERSQEFIVKTEYPYIFGSNIGIDLGASGLKFDTLFSQMQGRIGFGYAFNGNDKLKFFHENQVTNLISVDTNLIKTTRKIPENQSMKVKNYGVEVLLNRLDYIFNPKSGIKFESSFLVGTKSIRKDSRIGALSLPNTNGELYNIYDSMQMKMFQYRYRFIIDKFTKIGKLSTIKTSLKGESIFAPVVYFNELIRFGGVYSMRGFNEQSLFATNYTMLSLEYRYLLGQNSNIFVFWDGAYYEDKNVSRAIKKIDYPFGFGFGTNLETRVGILTLAYALGRESNNPIRLQSGKFHFGLVGLF